ncbi:MAG: 50S ribosomal protein L15 [Planctomycetes bacterium]|nr:50S ribosomal protein L15 [Planctomycetota bacterium]
MLLHETRSASLGKKKKVRVGRGPGSGIGKTSGRGLEGATSRSGYAMKVTYEGGQMPLFRRLPKRGFVNGPFKTVYATVNVGQLAAFAAGSAVGRKELLEKGVLKTTHNTPIKVLGDGELSVALTVTADRFSKSAVVKIEKAGGKAEWAGGKPKKDAPNFVQILKKKSLEKAIAEARTQKVVKAVAGKKDAKEKPPKPAAPPKADGGKPEEKK